MCSKTMRKWGLHWVLGFFLVFFLEDDIVSPSAGYSLIRWDVLWIGETWNGLISKMRESNWTSMMIILQWRFKNDERRMKQIRWYFNKPTPVDYKTRRCYQDARIGEESSLPTSYFSWSIPFDLHIGIKSSHYV